MVAARDELVAADLVAYRAPLAQVLSLPAATLQRRGGGLAAFGEMFRNSGRSLFFQRSTEVLMKVSLWAEIRRLHEIEGLSGAGDCPAPALLHQDRRQGLGDAVAAHAGSASRGKASSTVTMRRSTP